jgi:hypothetical protein
VTYWGQPAPAYINGGCLEDWGVGVWTLGPVDGAPPERLERVKGHAAEWIPDRWGE